MEKFFSSGNIGSQSFVVRTSAVPGTSGTPAGGWSPAYGGIASIAELRTGNVPKQDCRTWDCAL